MKRIAIALTALALSVPGAFAQTGGGSAGSGGSSGSGGAGGTAGSGQIGSSGQAGSGQSGLGGQTGSRIGGQTGSQPGSQIGGQSRPATAGDAQLRDQSESRIGGQTDSGLGGQSDSRTGGDSRFGQDGFRSGAGAEPGGRPGSRLDSRDGPLPGGDIDRFGARQDSRFDDGRRGAGFGDRRFDQPRTFEDGFDELGRGARGDRDFSGSGRGERDQRVQWISGRWWYQRNSGEWLVFDQQARQWEPFHPRVLEGGFSGGMSR